MDNLNYLGKDEIEIKDVFNFQNLSNNEINNYLKYQFENYYESLNEIKKCDTKINHQYFFNTLFNDKKIQKTVTDILYKDFHYKC